MAYEIELSEDEMTTLAWAADRGYFPNATWDALQLKDGEPEDNLVDNKTERVFELPEHAAWEIKYLRINDPGACFACIGGALLEKLQKLEGQIV